MYRLTSFLRYLRSEVFVLPSRLIAFLFIVVLLTLPAFTRDAYLLRIVILAAIFAIYATSWDLLAGYAGQINLGHALFFGFGAYTSALLNLHTGLHPYITIPVGAVAATAVGLLVSVPCLRLRRHYLALATLAFPLMLTGLVFVFPDFTGGELGITRIGRLATTRVQEYYVAIGAFLVSLFVLWRIARSRIGLIFHAIREDEVATRALGINTTRYKLLAFTLSGFVAGIAGALYAHFMRIAGPSNLELFMSFQPVIWTIFGGAATIYGPVTGVFLLFPALEYLRAIPQYRMLVFAVMVLLILRFMPGGLATWVRGKVEKDCPHCRIKNAFTRRTCRACRTQLAA